MGRLMIGVLLALALLTIPAAAQAAPANDLIANAQALTLDQRVTFDTTGATNDSNEPPHTQTETGNASVWFKFTNGPASKTTVVDLEGSTFDTVLAVYNSNSPSTASRVKSVDMPVPFASEYADFPAAPGATYYIAVDSFLLGVAGKASIRITQSPPVDDNFANARPLTLTQNGNVLETYAGYDSALATTEANEPDLAGNTAYKSQWFSVYAPQTGHLVASTCGSTPDTVVGVYTGDALNALHEVASDDVSPPGGCDNNDNGAYAGFDAVQGTTYKVATGVFLTSPPPPGGLGILRMHYDTPAPTPTPTPTPGGLGFTGSGDRGAPNGANAADTARLSLNWHGAKSATRHIGYGKGGTLDGKLTDPAGTPIAGALLDTKLLTGGAASRRTLIAPKTGTDGRFSITVPKTLPSSSITLTYRSHALDTATAATATAELNVRAGVELSGAPKTAHGLARLNFHVRLLGGNIAAKGPIVTFEGKGGSTKKWTQFASSKASLKGRAKATFKFGNRKSARYQFRAVVESQNGYPFDTGISKILTVRHLP